MQMRGNLHRYRVSPVRFFSRMLQGTFMPSYSPVLKNAGYGLLLTLLIWKISENCCRNCFIRVSLLLGRTVYIYIYTE